MVQKKIRISLVIMLVISMIITLSDEGVKTEATSIKKKTVSGVTYKIAGSERTTEASKVSLVDLITQFFGGKETTAKASKVSKSRKTVKIAATVKMKGIPYKVTSITKNACKDCKKLTKVTVGKNVKSIAANAFFGDKKLKSITINTTSLTKIGSNAFKGIKKTAKFYVPKSKLTKYKKLIQKKKVGWKSTMKVVAKGENKGKSADMYSQTDGKKDDGKKIEDYSYSVTPLTDNVCYYFYVKTDNPDPKSFRFLDDDTSLSDGGKCRIKSTTKEYADVVYTDVKTLRVKDGYIFESPQTTDGGIWKLEVLKSGKYVTTDKTVTVKELTSRENYLIDNYTTSSMTFFEKMDAVQNGLESICLYSGVHVRGALIRSTTSPYYGLSTSPHVDQDLYIQDPYSHSGGKSMLVSLLYPFKMDSIGFPSEMARVAMKLDFSATYKWNDRAHWLIDVTYNGETKSYGGQGIGEGQGITEDMVKYKYIFDSSASDTCTRNSYPELRSMIEEYSAMKVPEEIKDLPELTWEQVSDTVGNDGSYVRLVLITSIFGGGGTGYTFLYKDGDYAYPGYFSNAWYDGRYFNSHEFFEKGTTFDNEVASTASIIVKDVEIPVPEAPEGKVYRTPLNTASNYDKDTGIWKGFMKYEYDKISGTWIASLYGQSVCYEEETGQYSPIEDEEFKDALTLTLDEVKAMSVDRNANSDPTSYYIYDMTAPPGTKVN